MTNEDEEIYNNSQICLICKEELKHKIRDYSTVTGKSRSASNS